MNAIPQSYELWRLAVLRFKDWRQRRAAVSEISQLGHDGERMLAECGLSQSDFRQAMRVAFASKTLLPEAIKSTGVDAEMFENRYPEWNRDMRRTCMMCSARRVCSALLDAKEFEASYRDFCPNASSLDALANRGDCRFAG
ncbi:hypothetical protein [Aminobacter sp. LjRoot7]|uniref:hypothetical protein n=1 Tax=Aminobacter sp. LjRoot7 TaxID=3342335 RepID=UPI003ED0D1C5